MHPETGSPAHDAEAFGAVEQLNSLLRGEIAAAETYRMAIDRLGNRQSVDPGGLDLLREVHEEHGRAVQALRDRIAELGGHAPASSGAWGAWARFTQSAGNLFGEAVALKTLRQGEEHGLKDYQIALDNIDSTSADLVQNQLVPAQRRHINLLDRLIRSAGSA
jgi:hypothetical protein